MKITEVSLLDVLRIGLGVLWPCYNLAMDIVNYGPAYNQVGATGECPHCQDARLQLQIDEMAAKGLITSPLRQWAHEVRLGGNDGAHPDRDGLNDVTKQDADEIIEFTEQFLEHVYVMPAALAARQAARAALKSTTP